MAHSLALTKIAFSPWTSTAIKNFVSTSKAEEIWYWDSVKSGLQSINMHRAVACGSVSISSMSVLVPDIYVLTGMNFVAVCALIYSIRALYDQAEAVHEGINTHLKVTCLGAEPLLNAKGGASVVYYGSQESAAAPHVIDADADLDELEALTKTGGAKV